MGVQQLQQQNVAAAVAYTEYQVKVPPGVNHLTLSLRNGGSSGSAAPANVFWYMAPTNGSSPGNATNLPQSPTPYNTIPIANSRTILGKLGGQIVYFQVDQANQLMEVDYFSDT